MLEYKSIIGDAEQWPPSCASTGNNLARPFIAIVDQIDDASDLNDYGVPHLILAFEAESVSCRISNLLQSLDPQLPCFDSITFGLRRSKIIVFRGYMPHAIVLNQARILKTTICPAHRKLTADAADSVCAKCPNHVSILLFSISTYRPV